MRGNGAGVLGRRGVRRGHRAAGVAGRLGVVLSACATWGCSTEQQPGAVQPGERNDRSAMLQADVTIKGHTFHVAVARTYEEQRVGLMNVTAEALGQDEGMLFVFDQDRSLSFWMKNTIIPLDIAYINSGGQIVQTHTMKALDLSTYPSGQPARYALEVHAGRLAALGIAAGDAVEIPESVLKP
ncbi:MAG: DUF192 domain-containing protein [Phycisphaerae bacterium]|nr:DUF192 domain-containing protein [Phycisphaerae bacterium]